VPLVNKKHNKEAKQKLQLMTKQGKTLLITSEVNKKVFFSFLLEKSTEAVTRTSNGSLFHARGATTMNARSLSTERLRHLCLGRPEYDSHVYTTRITVNKID